MCGIWGILSRDRSRIDEQSGVDYIRNRGPDGSRQQTLVCHGWHLKLVHTRLAIIDLEERSNQPMTDRRDRSVIIYNGELYNYRELRQEMTAPDTGFRTRGDTEVLLEAWSKWGLDALPRFNGMFAFSVFDKEAAELTLVRDRFGVKPLVWGRLPDGGFIFSSSVAAVAKLVGDEPDLEYCARGCFYGAFERDDHHTPFRNVRNVAAGGYLRVKLRPSGIQIEEGRWYDLDSAVQQRVAVLSGLPHVALTATCHDLLASAVEVRLRSDVAVGCSLSGGLDSCAIAAMARRPGTRLRAFNFGHPDSPGSEGPVVQGFSRALGIETEYIWPVPGPTRVRDSIERTLRAQEAPFTTLSIVAQQEVFSAVRVAGVKVLLGGQGGDEAFAGYRKFALVALREAAAHKHPVAAAAALCSLGVMLLAEAGKVQTYAAMIPRYFGSPAPRAGLLDLPATSERLLGGASQGLRSRQVLDVLRWSLPTLLRYEDRNGMANGVESRLPFLDYRLMETALALPAAMKIRRGYAKWALREAVKDLVPDPIRLQRAKRGFDVAQDWVTQGLGDFLRESLSADSPARAYLRPGKAVGATLSDQALSRHPRLLAEALTALWLTRPRREPLDTALVALPVTDPARGY